jgi:hypothetical protein
VNCQSTPSFLKEGANSYYYFYQDDQTGTSQRVVLFRNEQNIIGYAGWSAIFGGDGYIEATIDGNTITGKLINFYGEEEPIAIQVAENSISTEWGGLSSEDGGPLKIPVEEEDLFSGKTITIYEQPNFTSKVLVQDLDAENAGFSITEIGKMEPNPKYPEESNIWYKVKNSQYEGWVFGLINSL